MTPRFNILMQYLLLYYMVVLRLQRNTADYSHALFLWIFLQILQLAQLKSFSLSLHLQLSEILQDFFDINGARTFQSSLCLKIQLIMLCFYPHSFPLRSPYYYLILYNQLRRTSFKLRKYLNPLILFTCISVSQFIWVSFVMVSKVDQIVSSYLSRIILIEQQFPYPRNDFSGEISNYVDTLIGWRTKLPCRWYFRRWTSDLMHQKLP